MKVLLCCWHCPAAPARLERTCSMPCMMATAAYREARSEGFRECRADWRSRQISAASAQQDLVKQGGSDRAYTFKLARELKHQGPLPALHQTTLMRQNPHALFARWNLHARHPEERLSQSTQLSALSQTASTAAPVYVLRNPRHVLKFLAAAQAQAGRLLDRKASQHCCAANDRADLSATPAGTS